MIKLLVYYLGYQIFMVFVFTQNIVLITLIIIIIWNLVNKGMYYYTIYVYKWEIFTLIFVHFYSIISRFGICCLKVINATSSIRQNTISRNLTYFLKNIKNDLVFNNSIVLKPESLDISFFRLDFSKINCQNGHEKCYLTTVRNKNS